MNRTGNVISVLLALGGVTAALVAIAHFGISPAVPPTTAQQSETLVSVLTTASATAPAPAKPVFDVTAYRGKPAGGIGMRADAVILYGGDGTIWSDQKKLTAAVQDAVSAGATIIILDNESGSLSQFIEDVQWTKAAAPKALVGVFGRPGYAFFKSQKDNRAYNDAEQPLLNLLDVALPCSYTVFGIHSAKDFSLWSNCLVETVAECGRVMPKKPVYPFLQVYYPPEGVSNQSELIPSPIFLQEVQACLAHSDGAMIWAGPLPWDPKVAWYHDLSEAHLLKWETSATKPPGE